MSRSRRHISLTLFDKARLFLVTTLLAVLSGCASFPAAVSQLDAPGTVALDDTPFFPQERFQCGPAALATILNASGLSATPDQLVARVYIPEKRGSIRTEMIAAVRQNDRLPYPVNATLQTIADELNAGRPVLILQNLGLSWYPRWHYAVVIGYDADADEWLLRSGLDAVRRTPTKVLLHTWRRSDYWGIVALRASELPTSVNPVVYANVISTLEQTGRQATADVAWQTLADAFPDFAIGLLGRANSALALDDLQMAADYFQAAIAADPAMHAARNNLAMTQLMMGNAAQALTTIRLAIDIAGDTHLIDTLRATEQEILNVISSR